MVLQGAFAHFCCSDIFTEIMKNLMIKTTVFIFGGACKRGYVTQLIKRPRKGRLFVFASVSLPPPHYGLP